MGNSADTATREACNGVFRRVEAADRACGYGQGSYQDGVRYSDGGYPCYEQVDETKRCIIIYSHWQG